MAMQSMEILLAVRRLSLRVIDLVVRMVERSGGARRRTLRDDRFFDKSPAGLAVAVPVLEVSVMERVIRRPISSMLTSSVLIDSPCSFLLHLLFWPCLPPPLPSKPRLLRALDVTLAKALAPFDLLEETMLSPVTFLVGGIALGAVNYLLLCNCRLAVWSCRLGHDSFGRTGGFFLT